MTLVHKMFRQLSEHRNPIGSYFDRERGLLMWHL